MSWTDERVEKLKELWAEGLSASQIAKALGGVTRNAVIGKVHRLGLSNRGAVSSGATSTDGASGGSKAERKSSGGRSGAKSTASTGEIRAKAKSEATESAAPASPVPVRTAPAIRDASVPRAPGAPTPEEEQARRTLAEIEKIAKKLDLLQLTERTCKWPIGDPTDDNFHFCGLASVPGKPYCEHHVAIAFQPMSTRRDRARQSSR